MTAAANVPELTSYIAGQWRKGTNKRIGTSPAQPSLQVSVTDEADAALAEEAIRAAHAAFPSWRDALAPDRAQILRKAADLLEARAAEIGRDLTREEGKTIAEATSETQTAAAILRYHGGQALEPDGETFPSLRPKTLLFTKREPLGVISVITPWNFPVLIPAWKIAPALAYGNTVVWKPADLVPMTAVHLVRALIDAGLPAGVLNLVLGKGSKVGDTLSGHPDVKAITFTGSNSVGKAIQRRATDLGKRTQMELGGKNPAIVLADADVEFAAEQVARGAFYAAGQKCTATSRVIVEQAIMKPFLEQLAQRAEAWVIGDPLDPKTIVGPVASEDQLNTISGYLDKARQQGGRALTGGARKTGDEGYFIRPTIFVDVKPDHAVVREEVFGPVAAVLPASSLEEAIALANDTEFGLSAALFSTDLTRVMQFTQQIHSGIVKVNQQTSGVDYHVPFGGVKGSGSGARENGKVARDFFTEWKTVYLSVP